MEDTTDRGDLSKTSRRLRRDGRGLEAKEEKRRNPVVVHKIPNVVDYIILQVRLECPCCCIRCRHNTTLNHMEAYLLVDRLHFLAKVAIHLGLQFVLRLLQRHFLSFSLLHK